MLACTNATTLQSINFARCNLFFVNKFILAFTATHSHTHACRKIFHTHTQLCQLRRHTRTCQSICPGRNSSALAVKSGNNKIIHQDILNALSDETNDLSMPCHEQRTGAATELREPMHACILTSTYWLPRSHNYKTTLSLTQRG